MIGRRYYNFNVSEISFEELKFNSFGIEHEFFIHVHIYAIYIYIYALDRRSQKQKQEALNFINERKLTCIRLLGLLVGVLSLLSLPQRETMWSS